MTTSKERVRAAIEHKEPDHVPSCMDCVSVIWEKLMKHYGLSSIKEVQDHFDIDIRCVDPPYIGPEMKNITNSQGQQEYRHFFGYRERNVWNGVEYTSEVVYYPFDEMESPEEVENYNWPNPDWFDYNDLVRQCSEVEGRATCIGWPGVYQLATYMRSPGKLYLDMAAHPEFAQKIFDKFVEFELEYYGRMFEAGQGQIDILRVCDDYGTQSSLFFSVEMWRRFFAENTRKLTDLAHRYGAYYMQHSCGAVRPIIGELIKCGIDVLDPVQKVTGMEPKGLKKDFGDKIAFHGGIDTQHLLPNGTADEVRKESIYFIDVLNRQGGYILGPSQSFEGDVPIENIEALYSARQL